MTSARLRCDGTDFHCEWSTCVVIAATLIAQVWAQSRETMGFRVGFCQASLKEEEGGEGAVCMRGRDNGDGP